MGSGRLGIIVSGGPAPGINTVISAAVIEAEHRNIASVGIRGGFEGGCSGDPKNIVPLTIEHVVEHANRGGSILGTSRFNPFRKPETTARFLEAIRSAAIDKLLVIGGEGSAYVSHQLAQAAPEIQVVHVPKTIDNDLPLPQHQPSFGFETARHVGTEIVETLMLDAKTCSRWFIVTCMGRCAGFLALGIGLAAQATLTVIPEEFNGKKVPVSDLAGILSRSVINRARRGKSYGVAVLAEGLIDGLDPSSHPELASCPRDELGRISYSQLELGDILMPALKGQCRDAGVTCAFTPKNIGYELRCHPPIPFDREYCTFLAVGAVELLEAGKSGVMITRDLDRLGSVPLAGLIDENGKIRARRIDLASDQYRVARSFMIRE